MRRRALRGGDEIWWVFAMPDRGKRLGCGILRLSAGRTRLRWVTKQRAAGRAGSVRRVVHSVDAINL